MIKDKELIKKIIGIGVPIALQNFVFSMVNFADVFMIGKLGETSLAAVGLSNQISFLLNLLMFGITSGAGVLTAQYWGDNDIKSIKKVLGLSLVLSIICSSIFFIGARFYSEEILMVYTKDSAVILLGAKYLKLIGFSYIIWAFSFVYVLQLRSIGVTKISLYASCASLLINVVFNYILIFGKFGFKAYGVEGAAVATVFARLVEFLVVIFYVYINKLPVAAKVNEMFGYHFDFIKNYINISLPVILNESIWALGINSYAMIYARMSTSAVATINVVSSIERVVFVAFIGLASATSVVIGNTIGAGEEDKAVEYGVKLQKFSMFQGIIAGVIVLILSVPILKVYDLSPETFKMAKLTVLSLAFIIPLKSVNSAIVVGILRGGGDTKFSLFMDVGALWLIAIPLAYFGGLKWGLAINIVYLLTGSEELIKVFIGTRRVKSKKWINNITINK